MTTLNSQHRDGQELNLANLVSAVITKLGTSVIAQLVCVSLAAFGVGLLVSHVGSLLTIGFAVGLVGVVAVWKHPPFAGYLMIGLGPSIVGFDRGQVLPVVRPNEALLIVLAGVLSIRWAVTSRRFRIKLQPVDYAMLALLVAGFVLPLAVQVARSNALLMGDVLYASVFVRLLLLYFVFRLTVRTRQQIRMALGVSLVVASLMGLLGTAGALDLFGLGEKLNQIFASGVNFRYSKGRGFGLIGNPIGYGVYEAIHVCIAVALLLFSQRGVTAEASPSYATFNAGRSSRVWLGLAAVCCTVGLFGSAQFGPLLAFGAGISCLAVLTKNVRRLMRWSLPILLVASVVIVPLFGQRIDRLGGATLPSERREQIQQDVASSDQGRELYLADPGSSWDVRLYNIRVLFLPEFTSTSHWVWGVKPQARILAPPTGKEYAWIESGLLWLFWSGGVPLFAAWYGLGVAAFAGAYRLMKRSTGLLAAVGASVIGVVVVVHVAQIFDPHATLRGTVDIFYPLLAMFSTSWALFRGSEPDEGPAN